MKIQQESSPPAEGLSVEQEKLVKAADQFFMRLQGFTDPWKLYFESFLGLLTWSKMPKPNPALLLCFTDWKTKAQERDGCF